MASGRAHRALSYLPGSYLGCSLFTDGDEARYLVKHWAGDVAPLFARTLHDDDQAFLPIILGPKSPAVPCSLGGRWLRRNGLAECIATECGYALRMGANTHLYLFDIEALCAASPEALAHSPNQMPLSHSPNQMPLSCPVAPLSQRELHKDGGGGGSGEARRARAALVPKANSCATSCGTSSATPSAAPCAASLACSSFTCRPRKA